MDFIRSLLGAAVAATVALLCSCAPEAVLQGAVGLDSAPPTFVSVRATAADCLELEFSEQVAVESIKFSPEPGAFSVVDGAPTVRITFSSPLEEGSPYVVDLVAGDPDGNTLSVLAPFRGRNDRPPRLMLNEIRTEYAKPKAEFVELVALTGGQLGGLSIVSAALGPTVPLFTFPPTIVSEGEFIVVHLRTLEEGCTDETEGLASSGGTEALPTARDFWTPGTDKKIRKTDGVAITDCDGVPLDAAMYSEAADGDWKKEDLRVFASFLAEKNAWSHAANQVTPAEAARSASLTATRTLCRRPGGADSNSAADWNTAATGKATPGGPNSELIYEGKRKQEPIR